MQKATLSQQFQRYKSSLMRKVLEAGFILEGELHNLVAIDTGRLDRAIKTDEAVDRGNIVSVNVGSEDVKYAIFVDQGVKQKIYNYHRRQGKSRPVVWVGVGQHYMERGLQNKELEIGNKIREARI